MLISRKILYMSAFRHTPASAGMPVGEVSSFDLKSRLASARIQSEPTPLVATGTLFLSVLLTSGWWEDKGADTGASTMFGDDGVQEWLFRGFNEWGPSFDVSSLRDSGYIFGQLGSIDEANSIPVIFGPLHTPRVKELMQADRVCDVKISGLLVHRKHLVSTLPEGATRELLRRSFGKPFDYCLQVDTEEHSVERVSDEPATPYSAYIWECLGPREWLTSARSERFRDVFFVWEHTDLSKPDAFAYNEASLQFKVNYIRERHPGLVVLQKSIPTLDASERTHISRDVFYDMLVGQEDLDSVH
jgi:hypothetical protein